jgi:predicted peptidase
MRLRIVVFFSLLLSPALLRAQDLSLYQKKFFIRGGDTLRYRLLLPEHFDASKKYPLILFLHGSGERGSDNEKQLVHGGDLFIRDDIRSSFPAIVVFPQCPDNSRWANYKMVDSAGTRAFVLQDGLPPTGTMLLLEALIGQLKKDYRLQDKRLYVGGLSMGGMGTFEIARRNPKLFAAAFPICGAADASHAKEMKKISWWIFHGGKDDVVPPASSIAMADALKKTGADVKLTIYPEAKHNSWDSAFAEKDLLPWMFAKHK